VHAQDRLFQMEIMRRLARGELAEVLGDKLLPTDTLFRSLRIREQAALMVQRQDRQAPAWQALQAYLDGVNSGRPATPSPWSSTCSASPAPVHRRRHPEHRRLPGLQFCRRVSHRARADLHPRPAGADYLKIFDLDWQPEGALGTPLAAADWQSLEPSPASA
jgi:penicillin amidase